MKYCVIEATSVADLATQVNDMIFDGWRPAGGVNIINSNANPQLWWFYQAMVKGGERE